MLALMISQIVAAPFSIPGSVNDVEPFQTAFDHLFRCTPLRVHFPCGYAKDVKRCPTLGSAHPFGCTAECPKG
jgi:hypothetical protein